MKDSKRHHYVTRAYMRRFAINDRVNVLFKNDDGGCFISRKPVNIENICVETNFYTLFEQDKRKNTNVEHMLAEFENKVPNLFFPQIQPDLIYPFREGGIILDTIQKQMIVDAIVVQIARGKSIREYGLSVVDNCYLNMIEAVKRQCEKTPSLMSLLDQLINNEDQIKNNALVEGSVAELLNTGRDSMLWSNLQDRICFVLINTTDLDFITSDEPVLVCDASRKQIGFFPLFVGKSRFNYLLPVRPKTYDSIIHKRILSCG